MTTLRTTAEKLLDDIIFTYKRHQTVGGDLPDEQQDYLLERIKRYGQMVHDGACGRTVLACELKQFVKPEFIDR